MLLAQRYELLEVIGRGGMGEVYRGLDLTTGTAVAVKRLSSEAARESDMVARLVREAEALSRLNHPNVVRWLDFVAQDGLDYLVMEYVAGGSLRGRIPLSLEELKPIFLDLCDALSRAHRLGIIHRDVKPDNVLLTEQGVAQLTDFGVAHLRTAHPLTAHGTLLGTPAYLSPEAILGGEAGPGHDLWSLGVMLFEALTGRLPFEGANPFEQLQAILTASVPNLQLLNPAVPESLVDLIYRLLEKEPALRPGLRQIAAELEQPAGSGAPPRITATPSAVPTPLTPWRGDPRLVETLAATLAGNRLLTLVGPGGIGKTRLAQELARRLQDPGGRVYWVPLAARSAAELLPALADALELSFSGQLPPLEQLRKALQGQRSLIVLDNFEHLLSQTEVVGQLASADPQARLLITSRLPLGLQGESLHRLEELDAGSAEEVFLNAARRVHPGFALERPVALSRVCRLLGGIPLALELVASWVGHLSLEEIEEELSTSLLALDQARADEHGRLRSMRAVFMATWELLSPSAQDALAALTVFRGSFTREAGREVAGVTLYVLRELLDSSLVRRSQGSYDLHELVRQLAAELLPDARLRELRQEHARYYCAWLDRLQERMRRLESPLEELLDELESELENLTLAWSTALESGRWEWLEGGWYGLLTYCDLRGRQQFLESALLEPARAMARREGRQDEPAARIELASAVNFSRLGRSEAVREGLERARAGLLAPADRAYWMAQSALLRQARHASDREALELARQAIPPLEAAQFRTGLSVALVAAAIGTWLVEVREEEGRALFREALSMVGDNPHPVTRLTLHWLRFLLGQGQLAGLPEEAARALQRAEECRDLHYTTYARLVLGQAHLAAGESEPATTCLRQALADSWRWRYLDLAWRALESLAELNPALAERIRAGPEHMGPVVEELLGA